MDGRPDVTIILATDPTRSPEWFDELRAVVRRSAGAVLISLREPVRWPGGPVIGVHTRAVSNGSGELCLGQGLWVGPLCDEPARRAVRRWLEAGGPQSGPPPPGVGVSPAYVPAHTAN